MKHLTILNSSDLHRKTDKKQKSKQMSQTPSVKNLELAKVPARKMDKTKLDPRCTAKDGSHGLRIPTQDQENSDTERTEITLKSSAGYNSFLEEARLDKLFD